MVYITHVVYTVYILMREDEPPMQIIPGRGREALCDSDRERACSELADRAEKAKGIDRYWLFQCRENVAMQAGDS